MRGKAIAALLLTVVLAGCVVSGCGLAEIERVKGLTRQQLAREPDRAVCYGNSSAARAEQAARNLGDCSSVTLQCRAMGYPVGTTAYLQCRQTLAAEEMAAASAYAASQAAAANAAAAASRHANHPA
jgi:hypothetical protein